MTQTESLLAALALLGVVGWVLAAVFWTLSHRWQKLAEKQNLLLKNSIALTDASQALNQKLIADTQQHIAAEHIPPSATVH